MRSFLKLIFAAILFVPVSGIHGKESIMENDSLLWSMFSDSMKNYSQINDYSCIVTRQTISGEQMEPKELPDMEITHLKPEHFLISFKDKSGILREFVFVDGLVDRIFLYPREYKISANGEFLIDGCAVSIPGSSLSFLYNVIIPLCEQNKNNMKWEFKGSKKMEETQIAQYMISFIKPVDLEGKKVNSISLIVNDKTSIPREITLFGPSQSVIENVKYTNIQANRKIDSLFFDKKIAEKRKLEGIVVENIPSVDLSLLTNPSKINEVTKNIFNLCAEKYSRIYDYTGVFERQEKIKENLQKPETFKIKFRKPFDLYMQWIEGPNKGWELIYASGKYNNKVIVHVSGLANVFLPTFEIDPTGSLAMLNNRHSVLEFGIGYIIDKYIRDINTAYSNKELTVRYHGEDKIDNRPCWVLETEVPKEKKQYYCQRSVTYIDKEFLLPTKCIFYEWNKTKNKSEVIEVYTFRNLSFNNGLTDHDFDRANKEYKF